MKTNKRFLLTFIIVLSATVAIAQGKKGSFSFTPQVGVALGKLSGNEIYTSIGDNGLSDKKINQRYRAGFTVGGEVSYQYTEPLAFSLGVFYTQAGTKYDNYEVDDEKTGWAMVDHTITLGYVSVPLMASLYIAPGFAVKAGLEINFNTQSKQQYESGSYTINEEDGMRDYGQLTHTEADLKQFTSKTTLTLPVGLSYEYEHVVLDARYHIPLTKAMDDAYHVTTSRERLFTVSVGYRF